MICHKGCLERVTIYFTGDETKELNYERLNHEWSEESPPTWKGGQRIREESRHRDENEAWINVLATDRLRAIRICGASIMPVFKHPWRIMLPRAFTEIISDDFTGSWLFRG